MFRDSMKLFLGAALALGLSVSAGEAFAGGSHKVHWTYEGEEGPEHWGELSEEYRACSEGRQQSPIDIVIADKKDLNDITFNYKPAPLKVINNGHTVQANYEPGSSITVDGVQYKLLQFHFHAPSEHTLGGKTYAAELHLVHKNEKGDLAVVGVFLEEGEANKAYSAVFENLPEEEGKEIATGATVNTEGLLPVDRHYYTYPGSLTTPPCSEGVKWMVLRNPVQVSGEQLNAFGKIMEGNSRPVQPLGERKVQEDSSTN